VFIEMRRICFQYKHFFKDKVNTTNAKIKTYQSASFFMTVFFIEISIELLVFLVM